MLAASSYEEYAIAANSAGIKPFPREWYDCIGNTTANELKSLLKTLEP